jgi:hypothetical protein
MKTEFYDILHPLALYVDLKDLAKIKCTNKIAIKICSEYEDHCRMQYLQKYIPFLLFIRNNNLSSNFIQHHNLTNVQHIYKTKVDMTWFYDNVFVQLPDNLLQIILCVLDTKDVNMVTDFISGYCNFVNYHLSKTENVDADYAAIILYLAKACNVFLSILITEIESMSCNIESNAFWHPVYSVNIIKIALDMVKDSRAKLYSAFSIENIPQGMIGTSMKNENVLQKWLYSLVYGFDKDIKVGPRGGLYYIDNHTSKKIYINRALML